MDFIASTLCSPIFAFKQNIKKKYFDLNDPEIAKETENFGKECWFHYEENFKNVIN